jgi:UDP-N-acetylglucosamine--dolichyl-phosphate N-acetylglucosaminephosphotransferase
MFHTYLTILIPSLVGAIITFIATVFLMKYMRLSSITLVDYNKRSKPILPTGVGFGIAFGFSVGLLTYIFGSSFGLYTPVASLKDLFGIMTSILLITIVGFIDDINIRVSKASSSEEKEGSWTGLKQWQKPVLTFMGAIPLMAINAGVSIVRIPLIGNIALSIYYPLIVVPLAIMFGANAFNLLGGFDGIATGTGTIAVFALLLYSVVYGTYTGALVSAILFASMLAFTAFNIYPARMVPGDSFTYFFGAAIIADMIIGNMESFGIIIFMPWIIEFILHARRKFHTSDLGTLQEDGSFVPKYGKKIYSWTHLFMNMKKAKEWEISAYMWIVEILFMLIAFGMKSLALL